MSISTSAVNILIRHLQNDVILLLRLESLRGLVSCGNKGFCYLNLAGMTKIEKERKNEKDSDRGR